jgi:NitT/TauT family transport system permease protein
MSATAADETIGAPTLPTLGARRWLRVALPALAFVVLTALGWEVVARRMASPLVPDLAEVARESWRILHSGMAASQIGITLLRILLGFALAMVVSLVVSIASARNAMVQAFFEPAIVLGLTIPGLVWALLCVIWFGISLATPVLSIALGIAPALTVSVLQGMRGVDAEVVEMAHIFHFSRWTRLRYLWLPALAPFLFSGARLGFSLAWKVIVLVELFGLSDGVGYQLNAEFSSQNVAGVLAWTLIFWVVMAALEYGALQGLERRLTRWRRTSRV